MPWLVGMEVIVLAIFSLPFQRPRECYSKDEITVVETLPNDHMTPLFEATAQAVEETIVNAMVAAETIEGINKKPSSRTTS